MNVALASSHILFRKALSDVTRRKDRTLIGPPMAYGFDLLVSPWIVPIPFAFDPRSLPLMLLVLILIATVASFGPALRASSTRIAENLRFE
jgi:ABC-type antimicrobial peptide transport system permease subunit